MDKIIGDTLYCRSWVDWVEYLLWYGENIKKVIYPANGGIEVKHLPEDKCLVYHFISNSWYNQEEYDTSN